MQHPYLPFTLNDKSSLYLIRKLHIKRKFDGCIFHNCSAEAKLENARVKLSFREEMKACGLKIRNCRSPLSIFCSNDEHKNNKLLMTILMLQVAQYTKRI